MDLTYTKSDKLKEIAKYQHWNMLTYIYLSDDYELACYKIEQVHSITEKTEIYNDLFNSQKYKTFTY